MKQAISFGALIGLVLVSVVTFNTVLDSKVAISEISAQSQSAATVVSAATTSPAITYANEENFLISRLKSNLGSGIPVAEYNQIVKLATANCNLRTALGQPCELKAVQVLVPNGGEVWQKGTIKAIRWNQLKDFYPHPGTASVTHLALVGVSNPSYGQSIALDLPNSTTTYNWTIPATIPNGTYRVRATLCPSVNTFSINCSDESDGIFTIGSTVSGNTELKISTAPTSPQSTTVEVDATNDTDNVVLLKGRLEVKGNSDVTIDQLPITLTTVGGANVSAVANALTLRINGQDLENEPISTATLSGTTTFNNLDLIIEAGDTVEFEVLADINDIEPGQFDEGDTLKADLTASNRNLIDAEDSAGDKLVAAKKTGTALGQPQIFRSAGLFLQFVSAQTSVQDTNGDSAGGNVGVFEISFRGTAFGADIYLPKTAADTGAGKILFNVDRGGTAVTSGLSAVIDSSADQSSSGRNYVIREGDSESLTLSVMVGSGGTNVDGFYRTVLENIRWNTTDSNTTYNNYNTGLSNFKTGSLNLDF